MSSADYVVVVSQRWGYGYRQVSTKEIRSPLPPTTLAETLAPPPRRGVAHRVQVWRGRRAEGPPAATVVR